MVWAHKYRGFGEHTDSAEVTDMFNFPVGQMSDFKEEVSTNNNNCVHSTFFFRVVVKTKHIICILQIVSFTTDYQRMDVYDVLRPGVQSLELYRRSLLNDGSYESMNPEFFAPDRIVFLDGTSQK